MDYKISTTFMIEKINSAGLSYKSFRFF